MATLGEAIDLVISELGRSDTSITAVVQREILKAIEFYAPQRFWFNEARVSFTASNTIYYPLASLSAYMLEIEQASVTVGGHVDELTPRTHSQLQRMDTSGYTGDPTDWAVFAEQIRLYPKCPAGITRQVDVDGVKRIPTLSPSMSATNEWLDEGLNLIAARVEKNLSARKYKDYQAAQVYQLAEDQELERLVERTEKYDSASRLKANW